MCCDCLVWVAYKSTANGLKAETVFFYLISAAETVWTPVWWTVLSAPPPGVPRPWLILWVPFYLWNSHWQVIQPWVNSQEHIFQYVILINLLKLIGKSFWSGRSYSWLRYVLLQWKGMQIFLFPLCFCLNVCSFTVDKWFYYDKWEEFLSEISFLWNTHLFLFGVRPIPAKVSM